jgi:molybdate transport system substrate-binding protein
MKSRSGFPPAGLAALLGLSVANTAGAVEMKPKTIYANTNDFGAVMAGGKAELALYQLQNLVQTPGVEIVGPLPGNLQETTVFAAAIMASSKNAAAGKALITFLRTADSAKVMKEKGLDAT